MILYHGTNTDFMAIDLNKSQRGKDFEGLKYMKGITFQYYFGSEKAIQMLRRL